VLQEFIKVEKTQTLESKVEFDVKLSNQRPRHQSQEFELPEKIDPQRTFSKNTFARPPEPSLLLAEDSKKEHKHTSQESFQIKPHNQSQEPIFKASYESLMDSRAQILKESPMRG